MILASLLLMASLDFYIGTYTSPSGSKGIYVASLDATSGKLSEPRLAAEANGPSFVALSHNGKFLYAVHEPTNGDVSSYSISADKSLRKINTQTGKGGAPCHVSLDRSGKFLFTSNYMGGNLASFALRADGSLGAPVTLFQNAGSGPDKSRQEGPHMHAAYADLENRFVYACDLGTDEVLTFLLNSKTGALDAASPRSSRTPAGGGPRHLAFSPDGKWAFVNNEMASSVTSYRVNRANGALEAIETESTLPKGGPFPGNSTAEIAVHPNGKWLYVSNRGHDSIAVFGIQPDGRIDPIQVAPCGVKIPRGFEIAPGGKWLVVAGQASNDIVSLGLDSVTGKLSEPVSRIAAPTPVCIAFVQAR